MKNVFNMLAVLSILAVLVAFVGCSSNAGKAGSASPTVNSAGELSEEELLADLNVQQGDDDSGGAALTGSAIADVNPGNWMGCQDPGTDNDDPSVQGTTVYVLETSDGITGTTQSSSVTDRCNNAMEVREYYCAGRRLAGRVVECPHGCTEGRCLPSSTGPICGDGAREGAEQCDDGNIEPYDGCEPTCVLSTKERKCRVNPPGHDSSVNVHYSFGLIGGCPVDHSSACFYKDYASSCSSTGERVFYTCSELSLPIQQSEPCPAGTVCTDGACR